MTDRSIIVVDSYDKALNALDNPIPNIKMGLVVDGNFRVLDITVMLEACVEGAPGDSLTQVIPFPQ